MHKATSKRLGEGLRKEYQPLRELPRTIKALLDRLKRAEEDEPQALTDRTPAR